MGLSTARSPALRLPAERTPPDRAAWIAVLVAALVSFVARATLVGDVVSPFMYDDEFGYVATARLLAGDAPTLYGITYAPGWGVLLAPAAALLSPSTFHDVAQLVNAALAAVTIPALHLLGRRVVGLAPWLSAAAAVAGGFTAASIVQSTMLVPETLLLLVVVLLVLACHRLVECPSPGTAVVVGLLASAAYAAHPRALVLVPTLLVVLAACWWRGPLPGRTFGTAAAAAFGGVLAVEVFTWWSTAVLYPTGTTPAVAGTPLGALTEPVASMVMAGGQSWYLAVASLGLVPIGFIAASQLVATRDDAAGRTAAGLVVVGVLASLALGTAASYEVAAGGEVGRSDTPIYGRYLEQWMPVLVVFAPALARRWVRSATVAVALAIVIVGVGVHQAYPAGTWRKPTAWHNVASVRLPVELWGKDHLVQTSAAAAVAVLLAGFVVARWGRMAWSIPLAAFALVNVLAGVDVVRGWAGPASGSWNARQQLAPLVVALDEPVWVEQDRYLHRAWAYNAQFWHPELAVDWSGDGPPADGALVLGRPSSMPPGVTVLGQEPHGDIALWRAG